MPHQEASSHDRQQARDREKEYVRLERRRGKLERKAKRAVRRSLTIAENLAIKSASRLFRVARKFNRPIRRRIRLEEE